MYLLIIHSLNLISIVESPQFDLIFSLDLYIEALIGEQGV